MKVLLERHLQIFHIARTRVLHPNELKDALACLDHIKDALDYRLYDLKGKRFSECVCGEYSSISVICSNQSRDLAQWLKQFAHGIVST